MFKTIEGVYRNGKIELTEPAKEVPDDTRVMVTFLAPTPVSLRERGIDEAQAADLRNRLASFAEEWESPEISPYDNYDVSKNQLETR